MKNVASRAVQQTLEVKIVRADGRVEDMGIVGYWHRNPLKRLAFRLAKLFNRLRG